MNIPKGSNNINFGWNCDTHKQIMDTALKDMPQFEPYKDILQKYVQQPDYDDVGFLANKHFYFGDDKLELSKNKTIGIEKEKSLLERTTPQGILNAFSKIFNTQGVSFMDYNGKNNAKAAYEHHVNFMDYAADDGETQWAIEHAARACHFLQDMTQPQHTEKTTTLGKAMDLKIHTDFEAQASKSNEELSKNYFMTEYKEEDINKKPRSFKQLFDDAFQGTREGEKITKDNTADWNKITQKQFNTAVQATKDMLKHLSNALDMS